MSCGSTLKLQHSSLSTFLHSHDVQYGSGSGQQSVTGALFAMHVACSVELLSYPAIEQVHGKPRAAPAQAFRGFAVLSDTILLWTHCGIPLPVCLLGAHMPRHPLIFTPTKAGSPLPQDLVFVQATLMATTAAATGPYLGQRYSTQHLPSSANTCSSQISFHSF